MGKSAELKLLIVRPALVGLVGTDDKEELTGILRALGSIKPASREIKASMDGVMALLETHE